MNKIQINLDNFQSIEQANLEFIQGINLITGEGNSGKSATLRAIKGAILNPRGSQRFIKNGKSSLSVNIQYLGNDITWSRTNKDSKYVVNGEEYQKVGNSNLSKILDKSGFVLDDNDKLMNVEGELELPFPFDKNPTDLFKLFEKSIFCVSDSAVILKTIKTDEETEVKDKAQANYELTRFNNKLKALSDLEEDVDLKRLVEGKNKLEELYFQYDKLNKDYERVIEGYKSAKALKEVKEEVVIPDLSEYNQIYESVEKLQSIKTVLQVLSKTKEEVLISADYSSLNKMKNDYNKLVQIKEVLDRISMGEYATTIDNIDLIKYNKIREHFKTLCKVVEGMRVVKKNLTTQSTTIEALKE